MNSGHQRGNKLVISERHTSANQPIGGSGGTTSRGAGSLYEVSGMMSWIRALVSRPVQHQHMDTALEKPRLSRQELTELFAKELGRPVPSTHARSVRDTQHKTGTYQSFRVFKVLLSDLHAQQRRG